MIYHPNHRCAHCYKRYDAHAGATPSDNIPADRCPGKPAKWPNSIQNEKRAGEVYDKRVRRMWTTHTTTFTPEYG